MFHANQIIRAKKNHLLAKVKFVDLSKNLIQIEYIKPTLSNYYGLFTYNISDIDLHWEILDNPDNKIISIANPPYKNLELNKECNHEWMRYSGLFESFIFCKKCDKKKV